MPSYIQSYSIHIASIVDAIRHTIIFNSMELLDFRGDLLVPQSSILHGNFHKLYGSYASHIWCIHSLEGEWFGDPHYWFDDQFRHKMPQNLLITSSFFFLFFFKRNGQGLKDCIIFWELLPTLLGPIIPVVLDQWNMGHTFTKLA